MPGVILGLEIGEGVIAGVRVKGGLRALELIDASVATYTKEEGLRAGLESIASEMDLSCETSCVSLPPSFFSFRNLRLPFKDKKKVRQTLGFELESMSPIPISETAFDFSIYEARDGSRIFAASIAAKILTEQLACLGSFGVDPAVVTVGQLPVLAWYLRRQVTFEQGLFLELGPNRSVLYAVLNKKIALIREISKGEISAGGAQRGSAGKGYPSLLCDALSRTLHAFSNMQGEAFNPKFMLASGAEADDLAPVIASGLGAESRMVDLFSEGAFRVGRAAKNIPSPFLLQGALGCALGAVSGLDILNFRTGDVARRRDSSILRRRATAVAVWLAIPLLLAGADLWVEYRLLLKRHHALSETIKSLYRETFPDARRVVDPVAQMKIALQEVLKGRGGELQGTTVPVVEILRDISARVPPSLEMRITRFAADHEAIRITGKTDTFNTVNGIKDSLASSGYYSGVTISSAVQDQSGRGVQFEMVLQRAR